MVKTKAILIAVAALLAISSVGVWLFISERRAAQQRAQEFFGTAKAFPTSGGQKIKPEW